MRHSPAPLAERHRPEGGFSSLEVLFAAVVLGVALLGHVASTIAAHRLSKDEQSRREVQHVVRQFVERMRSDDDWAGLYSRLRTLQVLASTSPLPGAQLDDGRRAWAPSFYYPDFVLPSWLEDLHLLVDVPAGPSEAPGLREDLNEPRYGLPADLSGDGVVDGETHTNDYQALPVVVTFRWTPPGETSRQLRLSTWLRGYR